MRVKLLFFGYFKFSLKLNSLDLELVDPATLADIEHELIQRFPDLTRSVPIIFTVNQEYVTDRQQLIAEGDEIGILPPLSGGGDFSFVLTDQPIDKKLSVMYPADCGATLIFDGTVRGEENSQPIAALYYDIYPEMADKKFTQLLAEMREKYPDLNNLQIIHRTGRIAVGEIALRVVIQSPHRDEALSGLDYCIRRIKEIVPIFKTEVGSQNQAKKTDE